MRIEGINFLCDGEVPECKKTICYKNEGADKNACRHTSHVEHAVNFGKPHPSMRKYWEGEPHQTDAKEKGGEQVEQGIWFGMVSDNKTVRKAMYYRTKDSIGGENLEVTACASGEYADRLLEMAGEMIDRFFKEAQEELMKGASEEAPTDGN